MSFKVGRMFATAIVLSLIFLTQVVEYVYAAGRPKIAFSSTRDGNSEIYVMDIDGRNQVRLTNDLANDFEPSWSPDGDRIAFVSNSTDKVNHIYAMDSDGQNLVKLTEEGGSGTPAWSPDGRKIAYTRSRGGYQVWVMDADGGNQTRLTQIGTNGHPAWSPDGSRIAFVSVRPGETGIYAMDKNGNNQERITQHKVIPGHPSWSPDGKWIAYESPDEESNFQISVVKTDGSGLSKRLTHNPPDKWRPAWSSDVNTIAYVSVKPFPFQNMTIHLMTARGNHLKQLSEEHDGSDTEPDWYAPVGWSVSPAANFVTIWGEIKKPASGR